MDWLLRKDEVCIILREQSTSAEEVTACALQVFLQGSGQKIPLVPGKKQPVIGSEYNKRNINILQLVYCC